jgi:protein-L-isoaspartate(D-aspartate) O-methyltransferase
MAFEHERKLMVETQIIRRGIKDKKVLNAMLKVPRHEFIPESYSNEAYADYPLPIGDDQTISQPYIVALMTDLLELKGNESVLEIGTGSGYQAAILAEIAKNVITIERISNLTEKSKNILKKYKNITLITGDGTKGYGKEAPYDGIIVTAAAEYIPHALKEQLKEGGILVIPVGDLFYQRLLKIKKVKNNFIENYVCDVRFVPLREG